MLIFTHFKMGNYFYYELKKYRKPAFRLNWWAFVMGNILPDLSQMSKVKHYLENTYELYEGFLERSGDQNISDYERSLALGYAIHFLSDFFCKYHAKEKFYSESLWNHFIYELKLHYYIGKRILYRKLFRIKSVHNLMEVPFQFSLEILLDNYMNAEESLKTDMEFCFYGTMATLTEALGIYEAFYEQPIRFPIPVMYGKIQRSEMGLLKDQRAIV